ncbi:unnamed protein product [Arabis nemorensis]|uniref:Uncharacterized protein n=1 Tax=Arabis nemorensis TaxID=586526 RepID=A0A565BSS6_9BRAS|nr:unnamed protein product [Arabis nemorensis]
MNGYDKYLMRSYVNKAYHFDLFNTVEELSPSFGVLIYHRFANFVLQWITIPFKVLGMRPDLDLEHSITSTIVEDCWIAALCTRNMNVIDDDGLGIWRFHFGITAFDTHDVSVNDD